MRQSLIILSLNNWCSYDTLVKEMVYKYSYAIIKRQQVEGGSTSAVGYNTGGVYIEFESNNK